MSGGRTVRALVAAALLAACGSSTTGGGLGPDMRGTWTYAAYQSSPAATLTGTMTVDNQSNGSFTGSLSVTQTLNGNATQLSGPLTGSGVDASTVLFDVQFTSSLNPRQHLGVVRADTVSGTWVELLSGGSSLSGSFRAIRSSP